MRVHPVSFQRVGGRLLLHAALLSGAFVVIMPYLWMLTTSLKPLKQTFTPPYLIPWE